MKKKKKEKKTSYQIVCYTLASIEIPHWSTLSFYIQSIYPRARAPKAVENCTSQPPVYHVSALDRKQCSLPE